MEKINVVLVVLDGKKFEQALGSLNLNAANLVAVVVENGTGRFLNLGARKIPCLSFAMIHTLLAQGKNFVWLISGFVNGVGDIWKTKKFLTDGGIPEDNIVNF